MEKLNKKLKIVFIGTPDMALVCLTNLVNANFDIAGVIPPLKTHSTYSLFKNFVLEKNLNLIEFAISPNERDYIEKIKNLKADIGVCCSYNIKLSKEFLNTTRLGYINCHPSLLPQYRGAMPYFHIINNGEKTSGITLHFMSEEYDSGDIIYQEKFDILPFETMGILFNRTTYMLSDALIKVLGNIEKGLEIKRTPQKNLENVQTAPKIEGNFKLNFKNSIFALDRLIRACNPFFGAYTSFRGVGLKVLKAHIAEVCEINQKDFGRILKGDDKNTIIGAKGGKLALDVVQVGTWGIFNPVDFYYTFTPKEDEYLI